MRVAAGNDFCGSVSSGMAEVVRDLVGDPTGAQLLHKVQEFRRPCPLPPAKRLRHRILSRAALAGMHHHGHDCRLLQVWPSHAFIISRCAGAQVYAAW